MERASDRPIILDASASRVTFEQIAAFPPPGWQIPRHAQSSPDGKLVTYLQSEAGGEEMALWALDLQTKRHAVLLRAKDLIDTDKPLSREEELRRERQRKRIAGVTAYEWAAKAPVMLLPLGGNVFVRSADGKISQLTDSDAPDTDRIAYIGSSNVELGKDAGVCVLIVGGALRHPLAHPARHIFAGAHVFVILLER